VVASAAGAAPQRAPAALSYGEKPPRSEVQRLVDRGYTDARIGAIYRRTDAWANLLRKEYGIAAVRPENRLPADPLRTAQPVQPELSDAALAAFHAIAGPYPSYTEAQIRRFERQCAVAMGAPRVVNVTRELCGDPAPR